MLFPPAPAAFVLLVAAVVLPVTVFSGSFPASVLQLERAFPVNQKVELGVLRAWDRARHARILLGGGSYGDGVGGVVDFGVQGSSDPYLVG